MDLTDPTPAGSTPAHPTAAAPSPHGTGAPTGALPRRTTGAARPAGVARAERGRRRVPVRPAGAEGYATAEAAVALPALLVVLALSVGVVVGVGAQLRCVDAARTAARVASRGDGDPAAVRAAQRVAPRGARVTVVHHGGLVDVRVSARTAPFGLLPALPVSAHADAELEGP